MYAEAPFFATIMNGPIHLSASFFFGQERLRLVVSSQTLSPTWYSIAGCFFLSYWAFIWSAAFSSAHLASACIFCICETNMVEQGGGRIQERHMTYIFVFKDGLDPPSPPLLPYTEVIYIYWDSLVTQILVTRMMPVCASVLLIIAGWLPYLTLARNMSTVSIS